MYVIAENPNIIYTLTNSLLVDIYANKPYIDDIGSMWFSSGRKNMTQIVGLTFKDPDVNKIGSALKIYYNQVCDGLFYARISNGNVNDYFVSNKAEMVYAASSNDLLQTVVFNKMLELTNFNVVQSINAFVDYLIHSTNESFDAMTMTIRKYTLGFEETNKKKSKTPIKTNPFSIINVTTPRKVFIKSCEILDLNTNGNARYIEEMNKLLDNS